MDGKSLRRFKVFSTLIMIVTTIFVICIFYWLYNVSKDNIIRTWNNNTQVLGHRVDEYLRLPSDGVSFSAQALNEMLKEKKANDEALHYLVEETKIYSRLIPENISGVYAFYNKEYLDGSGWVPNSTYQPKERPWYKAAVTGKGKISVSDPYLNLQTETLMMSVSQLLSDNESVVSMDIFLDGVQKLIQEFAKDKNVVETFIVNKDGLFLAHSDKSFLGKNFFETDSALKDRISKAIKASSSDLKHSCEFIPQHTAFVVNIFEGLFLIVNIDEQELYSSLWPVYIVSSVFIVILILIYVYIFIKMSQKYDEAQKLYNEVQAMYLFFQQKD